MNKRGMTGNFTAELLLRRIQKVTQLSPAEVELLMSLQKSKLHGPGSQITVGEGGDVHPRIIAVGWACRPRILTDGRCQMLSIQIPGDVVGDPIDQRPLDMVPVVALTPVRTVSAKPIFDAIARDPVKFRALASALALLRRQEEHFLLDHVVRLGRHTALQRVAHCLLELYHRLLAIGFVHGECFPMPLTQEILGDLLGLSLVHVNRVLSQLKRDSLIEMRSGVVSVLDVSALTRLADFSVTIRDRPVVVEQPALCAAHR